MKIRLNLNRLEICYASFNKSLVSSADAEQFGCPFIEGRTHTDGPDFCKTARVFNRERAESAIDHAFG